MQNYKSIAFSEAAAGKVNVAVHKPELLCPAGSAAAFDAAIEGGADAIYIGGSAFNARINAKNFTPEEMRAAISRAHAYGVKVYIAANTLIYDREMDDYLRAAETAYTYGADALRFLLVTGNSPGNDIRYSEKRIEALSESAFFNSHSLSPVSFYKFSRQFIIRFGAF